jgi:hypothetical protein
MNLGPDIYENKYKNFLNFFCYNCDDNICIKFSNKINGSCDECDKFNKFINKDITEDNLKKYLSKKNNIIPKVKDLLDKCSYAVGRENKILYCIDIYKILYYNSYFLITYPKFLMTNIKKIDELLSGNYDDFNKFVEENKSYKNIFKFMKNIDNYIKKNNINIDKVCDTQDTYDIFFENFIKMLTNLYNETIQPNNINMNNINNLEICLDI